MPILLTSSPYGAGQRRTWFAIPCIAIEQHAFGKGTAKGVVSLRSMGVIRIGLAIEREQSVLATAFVCGYESGLLGVESKGTALVLFYCTHTVNEETNFNDM